MGIQFHEKYNIFKLDTPATSYVISIVFAEKLIAHVYYGKRVDFCDLNYLLGEGDKLDIVLETHRDKGSVLDRLPMEYPSSGLGDFRESAIDIATANGHMGCQLSYTSHLIYKGKKGLEGLPATYAANDECETLEIVCRDNILDIEITLVYTVFEKIDAITRHVRVKNNSNQSVYLKKVLSACLDMPNDDFEMIRLHGSWARERHISRVPVGYGATAASSIRGVSSHQSHPFFALLNKNAGQESGCVYGLHLIYSGSFLALAERTQFNHVRAVIGISPYHFSWELKPSMTFTSPEAVLVFSSEGIGSMTRILHDLYRNHLIRGKYKDIRRPVLINNWEATYFDFNTEKLLTIAAESAKRGIEMFVLDDGWFGYRNDDNTSLGDWTVNEKKLPGGIAKLAEGINKLGMKFGIWMEPEMISPDSDLYKAHPDWAIAIPHRPAARSRNQYVLDLTRRDVLDYIYECIYRVLQSANIEYLKWDMNRPLTDIGSVILANHGEFYHRYMLGLYELQERLVTDFPELLLENCSGGGGRFDPGMLYYSPQIWCSDDTDAVERLIIQEGTALIYPLSAIGAHVSICPNHTVGRTTPFKTRGIVALAGTFGYELDITKLTEQEREEIPKQIATYHQYSDLIRSGDYYRIASYAENKIYDCWQVVSKDKKETLVFFINVMARPNVKNPRVKLRGLDENKMYINKKDSAIYSGSALMYAGLNIGLNGGDFEGLLVYFTGV